MTYQTDSKIVCCEDFRDARARRVFRKHGLHVVEIIPRYQGLVNKTLAQEGFSSEDSTALACGAVLYYELAEREEFYLPVAKVVSVYCSGNSFFLRPVSLFARFIRGETPAAVFEETAIHYERIIFELAQKQGFCAARVLE